MAKNTCDFCGAEIGMLGIYKLRDGKMCHDCKNKMGEGFESVNGNVTQKFLSVTVEKAHAGIIKLVPPRIYASKKGQMVIDPSNGIMYEIFPLMLTSDEIPLNTITGYSYVEDEKEYGVGHIIGSAAVGGMIFGGAGAVVGSVIGANPKRKVKYVGVDISFNSYEADNPIKVYHAVFYKGKPIKVSGSEYKFCMEQAKDFMEELDNYVEYEETKQEAPQQQVPNTSAADEIRKFKGLLDDGIITQEEFDAKKKELLGIGSVPFVNMTEGSITAVQSDDTSDEDNGKHYNLVLKNSGNKVKMIQTYREISGQGLREAKQLIDNVPSVLFTGLSEKEAEIYMQKFMSADGTATLEITE